MVCTCVRLFAHVWSLVYWVYMHMSVCARGDLKANARNHPPLLFCLFNKARSLGQTQSSPMCLVLLASLFWGCLTSPFLGWNDRKATMPVLLYGSRGPEL